MQRARHGFPAGVNEYHDVRTDSFESAQRPRHGCPAGVNEYHDVRTDSFEGVQRARHGCPADVNEYHDVSTLRASVGIIHALVACAALT